MNTNLELIQNVVDYMEEDLASRHNLDEIAGHFSYSKFHLHKMFASIVGLAPGQYIKQRRLSEAAKLLMTTERSIMDIAMESGYETQQSFSDAFKAHFRLSPGNFRKKAKDLRFTGVFTSDEFHSGLSADKIVSFRTEKRDTLILAGYRSSDLKGFFIIPRLWSQLQRNKDKIKTRISRDYVYALNDYKDWEQCSDDPQFEYTACIQINNEEDLAKGMVLQKLAPSDYAVFTFKARPQDSVEHILSHIYTEWFPLNNCVLNEEARYELIEYAEKCDEKGMAMINICIPIL